MSSSRTRVWNIFRKDVRHHWREIAASVALVAAMAWSDISEWMHPDSMVSAPFAAFVLQLVVPLVPISWMFLIVRAVQGESLVGDRQFWVTRPYDWRSLAAAKIAFVLVFVNLPLFLADVLLLAKAGFSPLSYVGSLFWLQLVWILLLFLPTAALATVTRSIAQMLLALLFIVLFVIGMSAIRPAIPNSGYDSDTGGVYFFLMIAAAFTVILLQYSRRKTTQSRLLLVGLAVATVVVLVATPYRTLIERHYPLANGTSLPLQLKLLPPEQNKITYAGRQMAVHFAFDVSGLPKDSFVVLNGRMLKLTNAQGAHWDSDWQDARMPIYSDQPSVNVDFYMNKEDYDRMKSSSVHAHLLLAFTRFHDANQRTLAIPSGEFFIPDFGFCAVGVSWTTFTCRTPLRTADVLMSYEMAASTCPLGKNETRAAPGEVGRQFLQGEHTVEPGISPVHVKQFNLYDWGYSDRANHVCPGTPVTISNPEEAGRSRLELQFDNFSLADYQPSSGVIQVRR